MRYVLLLPIFLVFIVACTNFGNRNDQGTNVGGVDMRFLSGYFPDSFKNVNANNPPTFRVGLELVNKMDMDATGKICVRDTPADSFGGIPQRECHDFFIGGKEEGLLADKERFIFPSNGGSYEYNELPSLTEGTQIIASLSYKVDTVVRASICLNKDPSTPVEDLICDPNIVKIISKEVVPVTVTSIEPNIYSTGEDTNSVNLKIKLKKAAQGEVVHVDDLGMMGAKRSLLWIDVNIEGTPGEFTCIPNEGDKFIRMDNAVIKGDTRDIECNGQITLNNENPNYKDTLTIRLIYGYEIEQSSNEIPFEWREDKR